MEPKIWEHFIRAIASQYTIGFTATMQKASKVFEDEASLVERVWWPMRKEITRIDG